MASLFSLEDGKAFVQIARKSIEQYMHIGTFINEPAPKKEYREPKGVFVSLHTYPKRHLRGCIGYLGEDRPLWDEIIESAINAAFADMRFNPLKASELENIVVEVSVLTKPGEFECRNEELPKNVKPGKHGLIARKGMNSGLLLPQVAVEYKWDAGEFLNQTCIKAGLQPEAWKGKDCRMLCFESQVFAEEKPRGKIIENNFAED